MRKTLWVSIDSEWSSDNILICLSIHFEGVILLYYNKNYTMFDEAFKIFTLADYFKSVGVEKFYSIPWDLNHTESIYEHFTSSYVIEEYPQLKEINLSFFYSYRDLSYFFGSFIYEFAANRFPKNIRRSYITQKTSIKGRLYTKFLNKNRIKMKTCIVIFKDLKGWGQKGGLKALTNTLNIPMAFKEDFHVSTNRGFMEHYLISVEETLKLINYSIDDAIVLDKVNKKMVVFLNDIIENINLRKNFFSLENIPYSQGAYVAKILVGYIENEFEKKGLLESFKKQINKWEIEKYYESGIQNRNPEMISSILNACGVKSLLHSNKSTSGIINAVVQGGRAMNDFPYQHIIQNVFDIDMSGCYGSALKEFSIPVGLPTLVSFTSKEVKPKLREFLDKYKDELVPNLWTITISGDLSYRQTLLFSKIVTAKTLSRKAVLLESAESDGELESLSGDFVLLEKELNNTILTQDLLEALKKIYSNKELKEIYDCVVVTAAFYKKSDEKDKKEFLEILESKNMNECYYSSSETKSVNDRRPTLWTQMPLEGLISPLLQLRKSYQGEIRG